MMITTTAWEEFSKEYFGEDSNSPMAESLKQAIDAYQFQSRSRNYNENEELYQEILDIQNKINNL